MAGTFSFHLIAIAKVTTPERSYFQWDEKLNDPIIARLCLATFLKKTGGFSYMVAKKLGL
ncbi:hypothetical protein [Neptunicoccus cionae]|uniref:hypothetical protein n=1 Tax=Neptunicoccus cionae TaxID=2035344 RepID=UPI000C756C7D|nr:hypothetical protein [Amylibacter cionae]PLS22526.1 hypothetical protein C0U40_08950 [Amylibacter cionae]